MTRSQLAEHAGLCERTVIRIEQGEITKLLLPSALAIAEASGVSLDWLRERINESGDEIDDNSPDPANLSSDYSTLTS